jgi:hypothetical protein
MGSTTDENEMDQLNAIASLTPLGKASHWHGTMACIGLWTGLVLVDRVVPEFRVMNKGSMLDGLIPQAVWARALCMKGALAVNGHLLLMAWIISFGLAAQTA